MANNAIESQLFYRAVVIDADDPMMLGRVRARVRTQDYNSIVESISNPPWNEEKDAWTSRDPFIFTPLLPYFIYSVPKVGENIQILFYNKDYKFQNQYYVQTTYSSPTFINFEFFAGLKWDGLGGQYKNPTPLKNKNGTYANQSSVGVFPEPSDNAVMGRNSADLIVKENDVLLRAGKVFGNITPNVIPAGNNGRAFLQLSRYDNLKIKDELKEFTQAKENVVIVKYLVEWVVTNPENQFDKFTGTVYLYKLKPNVKTNSKELQVDSKIEEFKSLVSSWGFNSLSKDEVVAFINNFIRTINAEGKINGEKILNESPFPFYYRPTNAIYNFILPLSSDPLDLQTSEYWSYGGYTFVGTTLNVTINVLDKVTNTLKISKNASCSNCSLSKKDEVWKLAKDKVVEELEDLKINNVILPTASDLVDLLVSPAPDYTPPSPVLSTNTDAYNSLNYIFRKIKLNNTTTTNGYGLVWKKNEVGEPFEAETVEIQTFKNAASPSTFAGLGADKIVLMSHQSSKVGYPKINMDGTLYGISNDDLTDEILPKTSSTVRGEELLELLNLIVRFLTTHTHAFPGLPPVPVSQDGTNVPSILSEMQNAVNKVLNQNIRIN
jgi:hypothetical protein